MRSNNAFHMMLQRFSVTARTSYRVLGILAYMAFIPSVGAVETTLERRVLTSDEIKSFHQFYQKLHPKDKPVSPVFTATRISKDKKWLVAATISTTQGRGFKNLCHGQEDSFVYGSAATARRFELSTPLPDVDVLEVLENANAIFDRYGAFIKGFSCRRMSTAALSLIAIGTGADNNGEIMYKLSYKNEADDAGDLLLRKVGHDFTPWDFRCAAP